jgi:hypothetical protein
MTWWVYRIFYYRIVANVATDACMACPPGLTCDGTSTVQPVVGGSVWEQDGSIYKLKSCPAGYYITWLDLSVLVL